MEEIYLSRYKSSNFSYSQLDHLDDALDIITFLTAEDFVSEQLQTKHGKTLNTARGLAKRIASHARLAKQYACITLESPPEISFLSGYYCILNLAKICSLCGPFSNEFDVHHRWHGATYNVTKKSSHNLMTEEITLKKGGALALFYKTLTGISIGGDKKVNLKDVYYLMAEIGSEVITAFGKKKEDWDVKFKAEIKSGKIFVEADISRVDEGRRVKYSGAARSIPCLKGFSKKPGTINTFIKRGQMVPGDSLVDAVRKLVRTEFLWIGHPEIQVDMCSQQNTSLPFPVEFASSLAFFHLSSVCRYNPEFLEKISNSKAWPMLLSLRRHSLFYFLQHAWSFIMQENRALTHRAVMPF